MLLLQWQPFSFLSPLIFFTSLFYYFFFIIQKKPIIKSFLKTNDLYGATYPIRTDDPRITSAMLWPAELKWHYIKLVTRTGIEPMSPPWKGGVLTAWPTGLIYKELNNFFNYLVLLVSYPRLERGTTWLKVKCSTTWANSPHNCDTHNAFIYYNIFSQMSIHLWKKIVFFVTFS